MSEVEQVEKQDVYQRAGAKIGDIVHYVMPKSLVRADSSYAVGAHRPALVVAVWGGSVNLVVFLDATNDNESGALCIWRTSIVQDETDKKPHTYHHPELM